MPKKVKISELQDTVRKGGEADAAQRYLFRTSVEKLFRAIKGICNAKPEISELLHYRAEIKYLLTTLQKTEHDKAAGQEAARAVLELAVGRTDQE